MAKKKNATRRIMIVLGTLVVLLVVLGIVGKATGFLGQRDKSIEVEIAKVELRDVTQVVTASGKVQPEVEVNISPDVSGEIIDLRVKEGDQVAQGTLLARIKPDFYAAQAEQAEAGVLQAQAAEAQRRADMLNAEITYKRQQGLFEKNAIAESDYQSAVTAYDVAKAGLEGAQYSVQSARARLREAKEQLAKTTIYAPMDGTVSRLNVELGERVVGTSQMAGTEMMRIAKLDQMELEVDVNENDVVNVVLGDTASIEIDSYPERLFRGVVTEIANSARINAQGTQEQVTNFPVKIRLLDPHNVEEALMGAGEEKTVVREEVPGVVPVVPNFRPGMSGTVDIYTQTIQSAVAVPVQSVTVRDFNKLKKDEEEAADSLQQSMAEALKEDLRKVVFLMTDGKAKMVEVETGISDDTHIVVRTGISAGETVITGPYRVVSRTLEPDELVKERTIRPGGSGEGPGT